MRQLVFETMMLLVVGAFAAGGQSPVFATIQSEAKMNHITVARAAAVRVCSGKSAKWSMITWQSFQITDYGACMVEDGQQFE